MAKPRIRLFALGGTIAMTQTANGGAQPSLSGDALVSAVPELAEAVALEVEPVAQIGSANLTIDMLCDLARRIEAAARDGVNGVVVVQGTDTLSEAAFLLALVLRLEIPVICTGAMRHQDMLSADGPANLLAAVEAASDPTVARLGPSVAMAGQIHAARFVEKRHTASMAAFASPAAGPMAEIVEGRLRHLAAPAPLMHLPLGGIGTIPAVPIVPAVLGDTEGRQLDLLPVGSKGLVIEAFGGGHLSEGMADKAAGLAARMPVVLATSVGSGPVLEETYGYKGAECDLIARGLIPAGLFSPPKARLLLALMLASGRGRGEIVAAFSH